MSLDLGELVRFRDLLWTLAGRDVKLRYRQTALGVAWVALQPLLSSAVMTIVFGWIAGMARNHPDYFTIVFAGQLAWQAFNTTITKSSASMLGNTNLVTKIYFPRMLLPLSTVISTLIDFAVALVIMFILMAIYRIEPNWHIFLLPVWLGFVLMIAAGIGLIASALSVSYRDVQYILPVMMNLLFFGSPIAYLVTAVPHWLRPWYMLNPLAGLIEAFRWSLLGGAERLDGVYLIYSMAIALLVFFIGIVAFKRMERRFADII